LDAQKELQAEQGYASAFTNRILELSPFSDVREFGSTETRRQVDLADIEPPRFHADAAKSYAKGVFMSTFERNCGSASSSATPLNQFGRDDAVRKMTEECIRMQN
jgi:hypothetical protein